MTVYKILARHPGTPLPADWRERLSERLGGRPRRLGTWTEIGLYGALECLADAGALALPDHATLLLGSQHGPAEAVASALLQVRDGLPLPLTFLQTQPSQTLAALSAQLQWIGDARFVSHPDPLQWLHSALCDPATSRPRDLLVGWIEERPPACSLWLRLAPADACDAANTPGAGWQDAASVGLQRLTQLGRLLRATDSGLAVSF